MNIINYLTGLFKDKKYFTLFIILNFTSVFSLYYLTIYSSYSLDNFLYINGIRFSIIYLVLSFLISFLFSLYLTAFVYKINKFRVIDYKNSTSGFFGVFIGALGSGCAGCSFTLFSLLLSSFGLTFGLSSLPLKGLELKFISIIFLLFANYFILVNSNVCKKPF